MPSSSQKQARRQKRIAQLRRNKQVAIQNYINYGKCPILYFDGEKELRKEFGIFYRTLLDQKNLSSEEKKFWALVKKEGFEYALQQCTVFPERFWPPGMELRSEEKSKNTETCRVGMAEGVKLYYQAFFLGENFFRYLRHEERWDLFFPVLDIQIRIDKEKCHANIRKLNKSGAFYFVPGKTINCLGKDYCLLYLQHAMERLAERMVMEPRSYTGYGDYWDVIYQADFQLNHVKTFESSTQKKDQRILLEIYVPMPEINYVFSRLLQLLDLKYPEKKYYKAGYFVATPSEDGQLTIITFLTPGMKDTPEYDYLQLHREDFTKDEYDRLKLAMKESETYKDIVTSKNFYSIVFFHKQGIPQVC